MSRATESTSSARVQHCSDQCSALRLTPADRAKAPLHKQPNQKLSPLRRRTWRTIHLVRVEDGGCLLTTTWH